MAEEEVAAEVEAVMAMYGDDCKVVEIYPPHLLIHLKPRTADVSSQQFVEAIIAMRAGPKYPEEPPHISIVDSKGLDDLRKNHLISSVRNKAFELASCFMLVALCEEAVDRLSSMNHPDGNCPLCLYPLVDEDAGSNSLPFMKLMSCFHCFHCDCIIRWWNWLKMQNDTNLSTASTSCRDIRDKQGMHKMMEESMGKCPVCRKVFLAKDIEHVLNLVGTHTQLDSGGIEVDEDFLEPESEKIRKEKFEAVLKRQQENSGLIEPKRNEVLLPGMYLPRPVTSPSAESEPENKDPTATNSDNRPSSSKRSNSRTRKHRTQHSRKHDRQWMRKESDPKY
ncbi:E3 ubiquitin- ligase RNF25 isoform X1 [Olea europaea subsp. europaea]|uniref:E3 ubiquitin- ligase RNF25 isoform X1 n=2 Tax=Olea europaea subsp. europaea TaxID=158383 RepID=A0A8S0R926_OLEEU|nr:E3 ubiquitin- ligase RNF25 isoform X1 [Olea europaea subsp. europaea]